MDIEAVLNLFDSWWFNLIILNKSSNSEPYHDHQNHENSPKPNVSNTLTIQTISRRDHLVNSNEGYDHGSLSPDSVLFTTHTKTIFSGKDKDKKSKRKKGLSKSLSELEFEELKGFMDLGFTFSEDDRNSSLVEIIPGLQRLGQQKIDKSCKKIEVERPYLSEAWDVSHMKKIDDNLLMKLRFPAMRNENDIKDSLKWWAHTVATTVG